MGQLSSDKENIKSRQSLSVENIIPYYNTLISICNIIILLKMISYITNSNRRKSFSMYFQNYSPELFVKYGTDFVFDVKCLLNIRASWEIH